MGCGSGSNDESVAKAAPRYRKYFSGGWQTESDEKQVKSYIEKYIGPVQEIHLIISKFSKFKSYMFVVEDLYVEKVKDPNNWPRNIRINYYWYKKEKKSSTVQNENHITNVAENTTSGTGTNMETEVVTIATANNACNVNNNQDESS
jgi:hypothetical protein